MTTVLERPTHTARPGTRRPRRPSALSRATAWIRRHLVMAFAVLVLGYLFLPIAVVVAFSFNDPAGRFNFTWRSFSTEAWLV